MKIGIIGGSGLYEWAALEESEWIDPPAHAFGAASDQFLSGRMGDHQVWFIPRHGRGHRLLPSEINHRANIMACKSLGIERIVAVTAVGSLRRDIEPGHLVLPDQYIDRTKASDRHTFFGNGIAAHIPFGDPVCPGLHEHLRAVAEQSAPGRLHGTGTYVNIEGPAFSTRAESSLYRQWQADVVGMTSLAEAKLCREAEICYTPLAVVTDYDCWADSADAVRADLVAENMRQSIETTRTILEQAIRSMPARDEQDPCATALEGAVMTAPEAIPGHLQYALAPLLSRFS